jgi:hypothetical protein
VTNSAFVRTLLVQGTRVVQKKKKLSGIIPEMKHKELRRFGCMAAVVRTLPPPSTVLFLR